MICRFYPTLWCESCTVYSPGLFFVSRLVPQQSWLLASRNEIATTFFDNLSRFAGVSETYVERESAGEILTLNAVKWKDPGAVCLPRPAVGARRMLAISQISVFSVNQR